MSTLQKNFDLALQDLDLLQADVATCRLAAGETLFQEGDTGDQMYVVVAGELDVTLQGKAINHLRPGAVFGEMALIDAQPRSATVTAVNPAILIPIDRERFAALVQQHPKFATNIMRIMSTRIRQHMREEVRRQRLEQELLIGRQIQLSLLPAATPQVPGWDFASYYESARQVGGDLYDFVPAVDDPARLDLVIADVTGKGVPAALFMAISRTLIRAEAMNRQSPAALLARVNELILCDNRAAIFLSAFYGSLDIRTGRLVYATAGHEAPLWRRAADGAVVELPGQGMLLGAFGKMQYEEYSMTLAPGDLLLLYTDGVTEARNEAGEFFGEERLFAVLAETGKVGAEGVIDAVVTAVTNFTGAMPRADDLTLVAVRRRA